MATDRELAARSMMQAGIGSLSGRPDTTYRDKINQAMANVQTLQMGDWGGRPTPEDIRQDAINWGQQAGLGNRISFAGERGRDILNPNEMRVNAPSVSDWKQMARRKMHMDLMKKQYQRLGKDNMIAPWASDLRSFGAGYGIPATNQGHKVMNALSIDPSADDFFLRELFNYGKRYFPGYDAENDEWRHQKYRDSLKKANPLEGALQGGMTGELYPDKILKDLYPQTFGEQGPYTTDEELNEYFENLSPEDFGRVEELEAKVPKWYKWYDKLIKKFGQEKGSQLWHQYAHRGGIIGLI